jgi:hypothetical protein
LAPQEQAGDYDAFSLAQRPLNIPFDFRENIARHFPFALSPNSTRRRIASERAGSSSWFAAQSSTLARNSSERRIARTGSRPVAGLPPLLGFGITTLDFAMLWYYQNSKPRGSANFRPGSTPEQGSTHAQG